MHTCIHIIIVYFTVHIYICLPYLLRGNALYTCYTRTERFEVNFGEMVYTVSESDSSVEVCINLTQVELDIFNGTLVVEVFDYPLSVYIPANGAPASELLFHVSLKK